MKMIRVEDAVGQVLCHDMTRKIRRNIVFFRDLIGAAYDSRGDTGDTQVPKHIIIYSVFFILCLSAIFYVFCSKDRSPIRFSDGLNQCFYTLCYEGRYLRSIINDLFAAGKLHIPTYDLSMGFGSDIFATLHYYGFTDPLNLLSVFFDYENMEVFFIFSLALT